VAQTGGGMDALFVVDRDARRRELSAEDRQQQRREYSEEWLQEIREACQALARPRIAEKRAGTSGGVHLKYVGEAAAVFRLWGSGAVQ
jgi:hypothetical protein